MKDLTQLMQQAQAMQQKLQDAQAKMAETTAEGSSGGGLVSVALRGAGEITAIKIDDSLLTPGEGEILAEAAADVADVIYADIEPVERFFLDLLNRFVVERDIFAQISAA